MFLFSRGFATGIYATNTPEACEYIASNSKANVIVVENNQQLQKILKIKVNLPDLKAIVQYSGEVVERDPNVYSVISFNLVSIFARGPIELFLVPASAPRLV